MRRLLSSSLMLLALIGPAAAAAANAADRACLRDMVTVRSNLIKNVVKLEKVKSSGAKDQCVAYRKYAEVVDRARQVFERCNTDQELDSDVSGMNNAMSDVNAAIATRCASN